MIRNSLRTLGLGLVILIAGCIPSLHPIYTPDDLVFEPELLGTWTADEIADTWQFSKGPGNAYTLIHTDDHANTAQFTAHLAKIGDQLFLDCYPKALNSTIKGINSFYQIHFIATHTFFHVRQILPTLQFSAPNPDWLIKYIGDHPNAIAHAIPDQGGIILTAPTPELQQFWLTHLNTKNAFGDPSDMKKKKAK